MTNIGNIKAHNAARWAAMHISNHWQSIFNHIAHNLVDPNAKARYVTVSQQTNVPWAVIAVIHEREASQSWAANLAQGDPWDRKSVHVPRGQGPFRSWEDAAINALERCGPYAARWSDWSIGGALTLLEEYNGLGYANRGIPSPYLWAGTDQYERGKYIADGHFDPNAVDRQLGCAGLLKSMEVLDSSITFGG